MTDVDSIRQDSWTTAINAFGTGYVFEQRANALRSKLRWIAYLGVAFPLAFGGLVLALGANSPWVPLLQVVAGLLGVGQLLISAWSLAASWQSSFAYAQESAADNYRLADQFKSVAKTPQTDLSTRHAVLDAEYHNRSASDTKQGLSDRDKRIGLRAALRQYERACAGCGAVPTSMTATACDVCGNF